MQIIVCDKKLMCTYIKQLRIRHKENGVASSTIMLTHFQALACHHAAFCMTISSQSWCLKIVVLDAMLEIPR